MLKFLYADDLKWAPRKCEATRVVVASWFRHEDRFEPEFPKRVEGEDAYESYWNLTAERCLLRGVISQPVSSKLLESKELQVARPFGPRTPTYSELAKHVGKIAMMCIPLVVEDDPVGAVMARLYCVKGIKGKEYPPPFKDGKKAAYKGYAWFLVSGKNVAPKGESWELAAHLLMRAIEEGKPCDRRRLARQFIATGAVGNEHLHKVGFGNKAKLADRPEFRGFTWIVPNKNASDVKALSAITVDTVTEAWNQVSVGLSLETRELIGKVRNGADKEDLNDIRELILSGADPNAVDERGRNARQYLMLNIHDKIIKVVKDVVKDVLRSSVPNMTEDLAKAIAEKEIDVQALIKKIFDELEPEWQAGKMCSYYGNRPLMFFQLAHLGQELALKELAKKYDVGAADRDGETALDFANEMGDKAVINRLVKFAGASKEKSSRVYSLTSKKMRMILHDIRNHYNQAFIGKAFERGVDPTALTEFTVFCKGEALPCRRKVWDNFAGRGDSPGYDPFDDEKSMVEISYEQTSLLQEAIIQKHKAMVELIFLIKRKPSAPICVIVGKSKITDYVTLAHRFSTPGIYARVKSVLG